MRSGNIKGNPYHDEKGRFATKPTMQMKGIENAIMPLYRKVEVPDKFCGSRTEIKREVLKGDVAMIQFFRNYTDEEYGTYREAGEIADILAFSTKSETEQKLNEWIDKFRNPYVDNQEVIEDKKFLVQNTKILLQKIRSTNTKKPLFRYESWNRVPKVGESLNWGLRSTSSDEEYIRKVAQKKSLTSADDFESNYRRGKSVIFEIVGKKNAVDIEAFSVWQGNESQAENLVSGEFEIIEVTETETATEFSENDKIIFVRVMQKKK